MIVFVGPHPYPVTGQAVAFKFLVENYTRPKKIFTYGTTTENPFSIFLATVSSFIAFLSFLILHRGISIVYLTTSRTKFGFLRDFLFILTAKFFGLKVCNHLHGADFKKFRECSHRYFKFLIDYIYLKIDVSIVLLPRMKEQYSMYPQMKIVSVNNCSEPIALNKSTNKKPGCLNLLYLSNVMYSKGIFVLIEAVVNLVRAGHNIELTIAGQVLGDEYLSTDEVRSQFDTLIYNKFYIKYLGVVEGVMKNQLLVDTDIFILPTFYKTEAQPISVIEAMMAGLPIITTNHNYMSDLVSSESGLLITTNSVTELENAILKLKSDPKLMKSISNHNRKYSASNFSIYNYVTNICKVLNELDISKN